MAEKNMRLFGICIETRNAVLVFLSEGEDQLGTLAASVPPATEILSQAAISSVLLGDRNTAMARMLAERLASKSGKIGLVSIYLKNISEAEATPSLVKLFEKVTTVNRVGQEADVRQEAKT